MNVIFEKCVTPLSAERLMRLERADVVGKRYQNLFPTPESWKWFRRTRKARLLAAGAVVETTAGDMLDPVIFDAMLADLLARPVTAEPE